MIYLKIENGKGYFLNQNKEYKEIDSIRKEDILRLLEAVTSTNINFEMNEIEKGNIQNAAHQIIYSNIYEKFIELKNNKNRFLDESENLYKEAFLRYTSEN